MKSKIKSVAIICQQGVNSFIVGEERNGLLIDKIVDLSVEYPDSLEIIYCGYTKEGLLVFKAINAPIEVTYTSIIEE